MGNLKDYFKLIEPRITKFVAGFFFSSYF